MPAQRPLAAIDIGTNAVRCKIVRRSPLGTLVELFDQRDAVRPGEGVFDHGVIAEDAIARLEAALLAYRDVIERENAEVRAVATAAFRHARNQDDVVARLRQSTGFDVNVISGLEEARLISLAALAGRSPDENNAIIDIGGGSTEIVLAKGNSPTHVFSIGLGALRLFEHFERHEKIRSQELHLMRAYVDRAIRTDLGDPAPRAAATRVLGTSGSVRALIRFGKGERRASLAQVRSMIAQLARMSLSQRKKHFGERRAEVIVGAAVILGAVMEALHLDEVEACDGSLRDGLLLDMLGQLTRPADVSLKSAALELGRRFHFDENHGAQTAHLVSMLFDATVFLHKLGDRERTLLEVAALLHDIGYVISRQKHHRHSAYVVENTPLPGITRREQRFVARLCRYHRRRLPLDGHEGLQRLQPDEIAVLRKLVPLLRLADALDRGRNELVDDIIADRKGDTLFVFIHAPHGAPLEAWNAERQAPAFRAFYGLQLEVEVVRDDEAFKALRRRPTG